MNKALCIIAVIGFTLSLIAHIVSVSGIYIGEQFPFVWALHLGIFVVWLPTILKLKNKTGFSKRDRKYGDSLKMFFKAIFFDMPKPVMIISLFCFVYATLNFWLFMDAGQGGTPSIVDGKYLLQNHGLLIKELTESEYFKLKANEIRGFSGHWMMFYSVAMGVLWPKEIKVTEPSYI